MTTVIKLDTQAMNALFPEGSTARVELQQAVLATVIQKTLKPAWIGEHVSSMIERAKVAAVTEVIRDSGYMGRWGSEVKIPDALRLKFQEEARAAVLKELAPLVREAVVERSADIAAGAKFDITRLVKDKLDAEIAAQVKAKVMSALSSALG